MTVEIFTLVAALAAATIPFWGKYIASYGQQKAKNLADKEDIEALTRLVESVKTDFSREMEQVKRQQAVALESDKSSVSTARDLLRTTYRLRDALRQFRSPMVWAHEFPQADEKGNEPKAGDKWRHVYSNRWKPLADVLSPWEAACLEAEVLFGPHAIELKSEVESHLRKLSAAMHAVIDDADQRGEHFKADRGFGVTMRSIVAGTGADDDKYWQEWKKTVSEIESFVRDILKQHLPYSHVAA